MADRSESPKSVSAVPRPSGPLAKRHTSIYKGANCGIHRRTGAEKTLRPTIFAGAQLMSREWSITAVLVLMGALQSPVVMADSASDQLDDLDREEFNNSLGKAEKCSSERDFECVSKNLKRAKGYVVDASDREKLKRAWAQLELDKQNVFSDDAKSKYESQKRSLEANNQRLQEENAELARSNRLQAADNSRRIAQQKREEPRALSITESVQLGMAQSQRDQARINQIHNNSMQQLHEQQRANAAARQPVASKEAPRSERPARSERTPDEVSAPPVARSSSNETVVASTTATRKVAETKKPQAPGLDALAFCWQNKKSNWFCDGRVDETTIGEKNLEAQLSSVGCKSPSRLTSSPITLVSVRVSKREPQTGWLYRCGDKLQAGDTGPATWNRDIRRFWSGINF